jgi:hypothetical protein
MTATVICRLRMTSQKSVGFFASAYLALAIAEKRNAIPYLDRQRTLVGDDVGQMDQTECRISLRRSSEERLDGIHGRFPMLWLACVERQAWSLHANKLLTCGLDRPGFLWLRFFNDQFHFFTAAITFKSAHFSL